MWEPPPSLHARGQAKQFMLRTPGRGEQGSISSPGEPTLLNSEQGLPALKNHQGKPLLAMCRPHTRHLGSP